MKVLIVHNEYGKYSGEEAVVDKMAAMLATNGVEVAQLRMSTAGARESLAGQAKGFLAGIYSPAGVKAMRKALAEHRPDVVNVHNLYPFISPAALQECRKAGVPVVMTVHNFRLICPTGLFMRDGAPCELCLKRGNEWGCLIHNCEHSLLKSLGYTLRNVAARVRRDYIDCVDRFACITEFQIKKLTEAGYDPDKLVHIPNSIDISQDSAVVAAPKNGSYVAYCGRLSYEKGADILIEVARRLPNVRFKMAGAVRDQALIGEVPDNVDLVGYVSGEELADFYCNAAFVVMPSRCYEGFPMAILEAAQYGKPVIGPDHGGFTEIIGKGEDASGILFRPGDVDDLERAVATLWGDHEAVGVLGARAAEKLRTRYSTEVVARRWLALLAELRH